MIAPAPAIHIAAMERLRISSFWSSYVCEQPSPAVRTTTISMESKAVRIFGATIFATFIGSAVAHASAPMPSPSIAAISAALPQCSGRYIEAGKTITPRDLARQLPLLSRPSSELSQAASEDLYNIATALLAPATGTPDWLLDGPSLKCPALPKEAVALMEYLVGEDPRELKGYNNSLEWLGLAYETGAAGTRDKARAKRYYLRFQMHSGNSRSNRWSDGIDSDLIANAERAGLRPYLEALAQKTRGGGAARLALAEAALPTDPAKARRLLRYMDGHLLNRLIELEDQGRIAMISDAAEIAFWADAARTLIGYQKFAGRMLRSVESVNGGTIPTSPRHIPIDLLRRSLDTKAVATANPTTGPIPVRALVTPEGRAIWIEACQAEPAKSMPIRDFKMRIDAARLYNLANLASLPKLPAVKAKGRSLYTWVLLPAVHFARSAEGAQKLDFVDLVPGSCVYSAIVDAPPPPTAQPSR